MSLKVELGDFQTPYEWAKDLTRLLLKKEKIPEIIVEPTCGVGAFVQAAATLCPAAKVFGYDINSEYVEIAKEKLADKSNVTILCEDFFSGEFNSQLSTEFNHILFLGNPPWVTNSKLGSLGSSNLPEKKNSESLRGIEAITGKSNFDISEWMICRMLDCIQSRSGTVAMICKSSVARKTLSYAVNKKLNFSSAKFFPLNAKQVFNVSVDCGFFVFNSYDETAYDVEVLDLDFKHLGKYGSRNGRLVSDVFSYDQWSFLDGVNLEKWRSGIKHDCSSVFEFIKQDNVLLNGKGEAVEIEQDFLFPFLKSSDLANGRTERGDRFVLVTQEYIGQETHSIEKKAPKTWAYLNQHKNLLDSRKSSIYRNKPDFSIFGVGSYSFTPWKIAISGLYKSLNFVKLGPQDGRPVMVDDTCYFLSCESEEKANLVFDLLKSDQAKLFLSSIIFWDSKRPVSVDILQRLKLDSIPNEIAEQYRAEVFSGHKQGQLFLDGASL
ncbi:class I SAM-dependent methyltransferase [Bdellovibrio bacteriovorus]|uniref:class I SAM-dependent methyltransferase n=1 Tax=Bdellovibrio bacteriovorus TaxID=959 RepID=UPI0021CE4E9B|nr:class I SAM-dependent methyltransferase [Bdellovibrio bacteriovorus]UXR65657.1 class I SAM-dependent methyltransferase [Bdellovibrio bacteriovorus]